MLRKVLPTKIRQWREGWREGKTGSVLFLSLFPVEKHIYCQIIGTKVDYSVSIIEYQPAQICFKK